MVAYATQQFIFNVGKARTFPIVLEMFSIEYENNLFIYFKFYLDI